MDLNMAREKMAKLGTMRLAVWQTKGLGPSSTKIVYLNMGIISAYGWLLMVATFCGVYLATGKADPIFAGVITFTLPVVIGFATSAQKAKNKDTIANLPKEEVPKCE